MDPPVYQVRYRSWKALARDCEQQMSMRGLLLKTEAEVSPFARVSVRVVTPDAESFELAGEVVQVVAGQGIAVQFAAGAAPTIQRLKDMCAQQSPGQKPAPTDDPEVFPPGQKIEPAAPRAHPTGGDSENLQKQIEQMSVAQKRQAALHGKKGMRMLLVRDRNKTIHPFVIRNPAITLDEIEQIAKMPSVNPDVLRTIAKSKEWTRSTSVCRNLVRNPKTPMKEALTVLQKLPMGEVRALAKSSNVRTAIQQAARKKVTG